MLNHPPSLRHRGVLEMSEGRPATTPDGPRLCSLTTFTASGRAIGRKPVQEVTTRVYLRP